MAGAILLGVGAATRLMAKPSTTIFGRYALISS